MGGRHTRIQIAAFTNGEYRQVWAKHRTTDQAIYLREGTAKAVRDTAKTEWRCPVPGCTDAITTRAGSRRDHFVHYTGKPRHGQGESEWHLQGKAMLAAWAKSHPDWTVREEETVKDGVSRMHRRADVMATHNATGTKVAFEVEYKPFSPEEWAAKHAEYLALGIVPVWVFGHTHRYLALTTDPRSSGTEEEPWDHIRVRELTAAVAATGTPVLYINPIEQAIGTAWRPSVRPVNLRPGEGEHLEGDAYNHQGRVPGDFFRLAIDALTDCTLDPQRGLITPTMARIDGARAALAEAQATERERLEGAWTDDPLHAAILTRYPSIPGWIRVNLPSDAQIPVHAHQWHAHLFTDLVLGQASDPGSHLGNQYRFREVIELVTTRWPGTYDAVRPVLAYLDLLRMRGFVAFERDAMRPITKVLITADLDTPPGTVTDLPEVTGTSPAADHLRMLRTGRTAWARQPAPHYSRASTNEGRAFVNRARRNGETIPDRPIDAPWARDENGYPLPVEDVIRRMRRVAGRCTECGWRPSDCVCGTTPLP